MQALEIVFTRCLEANIEFLVHLEFDPLKFSFRTRRQNKEKT